MAPASGPVLEAAVDVVPPPAPAQPPPSDAVIAARAQTAAVVVERPAAPVPEAPAVAEEPARPVPAERAMAWGWLSALMLVGALGLLTMIAGDAFSRAGREGAEPLFWAGFLLITVPVTARLVSRAPTRLERVLLVVGVGALLYVSKVLHDAFGFIYADELIHLGNAEAILRTGGIFPENTLLPVTVYYPGLGALTAGLADLTGLSAFGAGLIVIGVARLIMMLALFLLFERLSGSSRVAGLAALVYCASPNFLFWSSQYSYQSLALPLAVLALLAVAQRDPDRGPEHRFAWMVIPMLAITAVTMTHHLTAYALAAILVLVSLAAAVGFGSRSDSAWGLVLFAGVATIAWLLQVAPLTGDYLSQIFTATFDGIRETVAGSSGTRQLFESDGGTTAPPWERLAGLASVALVALALPFGLWRVWRMRGRSAMLVVLAVAGAAYLAILPLRLVPSAWETANRASDFLYVGIALTVALGARRIWRPDARTWLLAPAACVLLAVVMVGGVISGWAPSVRLSQPYRATVGGNVIEPQGTALARWSLDTIGPDRLWAADQSNARFLLAQGRQLPLILPDWRARALLEPVEPVAEGNAVMRSTGVVYAVIDRRSVASDNLAGYFFAPAGEDRAGSGGLIAPDRLARLDVPSTDRIFDSGDIAVYDVWRIEP